MSSPAEFISGQLSKKFFTCAGLGAVVGMGLGLICSASGATPVLSAAISFGTAAAIGGMHSLRDFYDGDIIPPSVGGAAGFLGATTFTALMTSGLCSLAS